MPRLKTYDLFLSHVWRKSHNAEYYRLVSLLTRATNFKWRNYSVPEHDPLGTRTNVQLRRALDRQVAPVSCFLVIAGMYVNHRKWIQEELEIAKAHEKPIVALVPMGQQRTPMAVRDMANELVAWRTASIVAAVRKWSL